MAIAGHAGHLVGLDFCHHVRCFTVARLLFKRSRAEVAMETLAIIVGGIKLDLVGLRNSSEILDINVVKASEFCMKGTEQRVVRMAGVTSVVARHEVVLKVAGRNEAWVVDVEASAVV